MAAGEAGIVVSMQHYLIRRLLLFIPTVILASLLIFLAMRIIPGDPALAILAGEGGEGSFTQSDLEKMREKLGLNRPLHIQYLDWMRGLATLDLGNSLRTSRAIADELKLRLPITLELTFLAMVFTLLAAIPMGVLAAIRRDTWVDYTVTSLAIMGLAFPTFWVGLLLLLGLVSALHWMPPLGYAQPWQEPMRNLQQLFWPAVALSYNSIGTLARMTRAQMLEVMRQDYIRTAWAKGLEERRVVYVHALKNALLPIITIIGILVGTTLAGTVAIEIIFSVPGMGKLLLDAVFSRDYPVVQNFVMYLVLAYLIINLLVDLAYGQLDPRIRYAG